MCRNGLEIIVLKFVDVITDEGFVDDYDLVLAIRTLHGIRDNIWSKEMKDCPRECLCYKIKLLKFVCTY